MLRARKGLRQWQFVVVGDLGRGTRARDQKETRLPARAEQIPRAAKSTCQEPACEHERSFEQSRGGGQWPQQAEPNLSKQVELRARGVQRERDVLVGAGAASAESDRHGDQTHDYSGILVERDDCVQCALDERQRRRLLCGTPPPRAPDKRRRPGAMPPRLKPQNNPPPCLSFASSSASTLAWSACSQSEF